MQSLKSKHVASLSRTQIIGLTSLSVITSSQGDQEYLDNEAGTKILSLIILFDAGKLERFEEVKQDAMKWLRCSKIIHENLLVE